MERGWGVHLFHPSIFLSCLDLEPRYEPELPNPAVPLEGVRVVDLYDHEAQQIHSDSRAGAVHGPAASTQEERAFVFGRSLERG